MDRRADVLARRVGPGDIAVFDQVDLDRRTADALVAAGITAVINAAPSISGRFPNLGPEILISAGIVLIDGVGSEVLRIKEGSRLRLHDGRVYIGDTEVACGIEQTANSIADLMIEAKSGLSAQLEAFSANTIEFLRHERALIIDRVGVPDIEVPIRGRQVLVVAAGYNHIADLAALKHFIREYHPVLIGVEAAPTRCAQLGTSRTSSSATRTRCGPRRSNRPARSWFPPTRRSRPGLERIQDLGIGAVTFPAVGHQEELALLLAERARRELIVTVGMQATLDEFLDRGAADHAVDLPDPARLGGSSSTPRPPPHCTGPGSRRRRAAARPRRARRGRRGAAGRPTPAPTASRHRYDWDHLFSWLRGFSHDFVSVPLVSLAAVFLALALGVVLGTTRSPRYWRPESTDDLRRQTAIYQAERNAPERPGWVTPTGSAPAVGPRSSAARWLAKKIGALVAPDAPRPTVTRVTAQSRRPAPRSPASSSSPTTSPTQPGPTNQCAGPPGCTRPGCSCRPPSTPGTLAGGLLGSLLLIDTDTASRRPPG